MKIDFSVIAAKSGFEVASGQFVPLFIPQAESPEMLPPHRPWLPWANEDQGRHYTALFEYLMRQVGAEIDDLGDRETSIKRMDLASLLHFFAPIGKTSPKVGRRNH